MLRYITFLHDIILHYFARGIKTNINERKGNWAMRGKPLKGRMTNDGKTPIRVQKQGRYRTFHFSYIKSLGV